MSFGARVDVRPAALEHNLERLMRCAPGTRVIAAVKANAYGHGLVAVSRVLADAGTLAVARLVEARALRRAGLETPILLMGGVIDRDELATAASLDLGLVIHSEQQVALLEDERVDLPQLWLKIDTGMHRLGVAPEDCDRLARRLSRIRDGRPPGLMTHLSSADDPDDGATAVQAARFAELAADHEGDLSIANSALLLGWPELLASTLDGRSADSVWIRPGISLYGISPMAGGTGEDHGLKPAMNFDTTLIAVKPLAAGEAVGYGGTWRAPRDTMLGIAAAGYGDGYSRFIPSGTAVLVNGRRASLAGVISMDLCAIDLGTDANDRAGDPVRLWGEGLPVEDVAAAAGTTAYPLVTGVRER